MPTDADYRALLVECLSEHVPLSSRVRAAFLAVPRHRFLPPADGVESEQWLAEAYQDQAIATQYDARGRPSSSSSQPSVMALMLEALAVQPGQRVLEIGTGTGYHAALLAHLAGDPACVTSIELDPVLVDLARVRIANVVGAGMRLVVGDGRSGVPEHAPYERIIATASAFPVPPAWIEQLLPGGRLVLDLRGKIGGGLVAISKQAEGRAGGHFLPTWEPISFMALREPEPVEENARATTGVAAWDGEPRDDAEGTIEDACAQHFWSYERFRGPDDAWNVWLQAAWPQLTISWQQRGAQRRVVLAERGSQTTLTIKPQGQQMRVAVVGSSSLWSEIIQLYREWLALDKPGRECLAWEMTPEGQLLRMTQGDRSRVWPLASC